MAGLHLTSERTLILEALDSCPCTNYIVMFRGAKSTLFRGLYSFNLETHRVEKIYGKGPSVISTEMVTQFYRYNSGRKEFSAVPTRSFTVKTDAAGLDENCFRPAKKSTL